MTARFASSLLAAAGAALLLAAVAALAQDTAPPPLRVPDPDMGVRLLEARGEAQRRAVAGVQVFHGFGFTDRQPESGITFEHESVDDSLSNWMPVHYDHGNGVVAADVDGDGLPDLYFTTQLGSNQLWRNRGGGRFEDWTARAGVGLADRIGVTASFADYDNDGDPDLFATTVRGGNALFRNDGQGKFTDVSSAAGVDYSGHSSGAVFFDYDLDGQLDLFVTNVGVYTTQEKGRGGFYRGIDDAFQGHVYPERSEQSILYRNRGDGTFEDVSASVGLQDVSWSGDATAVDLNGDRYPDLYVLNMQGDDHYYENRGGERFVDRTAELFPKTSWGAMGVRFFDWNNDGRLDLYVTDMHSDMHDEQIDPLRDEKTKIVLPLKGGENNVLGNSFYEQRADGGFEEVSDLIGAENFWPWGLSAADFNADGWEDVFVASSMNYPYRYAVNSLLLNDRGRRLVDAEFVLGVEPRRDGRTDKPLFVLDCDGEHAEHHLCTERSGRFTVVGALGTRASAVLDLDADGDLDVVTNEFNDVPQVLISDLSERRAIRFLKLTLRGRRSNRDGLGAVVTVRAGDAVYVRHHDGKSGYLVQSSLPLYVGLGDAERVDEIEVRWPSGTVQTVPGPIAAPGELELVEPEGGEPAGGEPGGGESAAAEPGARPADGWPTGDLPAAGAAG